MNREVHVRVCEGLRGKFPWSTRPWIFENAFLLQVSPDICILVVIG
jgi:hypothetical protein